MAQPREASQVEEPEHAMALWNRAKVALAGRKLPER